MTFEDAIIYMFKVAGNESPHQLAHFLRVGLAARDKHGENHGIVGLLHDLVEDGWATPDEMRGAGIPHDLVDFVWQLTRTPEQEYGSYIFQICNCHPLVRDVKKIDIMDNLMRKPKHASHEERYKRSLEILNGIVTER